MLTQRARILMQKIQNMSELDFTMSVVMPLFQSFGYSVNYNGGPGEKGKDVICKKEGEFGSTDLTVVQVKKTRPTAVAADSRSLSEIITQLQQAAEENIPMISGQYQKPNKVYFITPYEIGARELESRFAGLQALSLKNVRVLDGKLIVESLQARIPKLADALCGGDYLLKSNAVPVASNAELLSALNYSNEKDIVDFYCDLDFSVGRITSKLFFSLEFAPKSITQRVTRARWMSMSAAFTRFSRHCSIEVIQPPLAEVETEFERQWQLWESENNREIYKRIWAVVGEIEELLRFVIDEAADIVGTVMLLNGPNVSFAEKKARYLTVDEHARLGELRLAKNNLESELISWFENTEITENKIDKMRAIIGATESHIEDLRHDGGVINAVSANRLTNVMRNVRRLNDLFVSLQAAAALRTPEPTFNFAVDGTVIVNALVGYRQFVADGAAGLTERGSDSVGVREYFLKCREIFELVELVLDERLLSDAAGIDTTQKFAIAGASRRIHLPVRDVFATGIHCAVYGDAGAGKTTTLHRYAATAAKSCGTDEIILWLPLTRVLSKSEALDDETVEPLEKLERAVSKYVEGVTNIPHADVIPLLRGKSRAVFMFDGIDEVIKRAPWIISAIQSVCSQYGQSQVIVSARSTGSYPELRNFLGLTLLPFTDEQVRDFVTGWFQNDPRFGTEVADHLKRIPSVAEIVRNPLLATVLCVLAENKVPLPSGELAMYEERMKLLLGHYDIHKKTRRLNTHHSLLDITARQVAYQLHNQNIRSAPVEALELFAIQGLSSIVPHPGTSQIRQAVGELIDPCNVLVPMTNEGAFGFGHLRYQEYLCAKELHQNRSLDLLPLLTSSWWRPVIVLFCRMGGKVDFIINDVIGKEHTVEKFRDTLLAVISTRGREEQRRLKALILEHRKMDTLSDDIRELSEYSYDIGDLSELGIDFDRLDT